MPFLSEQEAEDADEEQRVRNANKHKPSTDAAKPSIDAAKPSIDAAKLNYSDSKKDAIDPDEDKRAGSKDYVVDTDVRSPSNKSADFLRYHCHG